MVLYWLVHWEMRVVEGVETVVDMEAQFALKRHVSVPSCFNRPKQSHMEIVKKQLSPT